MTILSQPIENNNTIYYSPRVGTGFSNNFRAIRGLMLLGLLFSRNGVLFKSNSFEKSEYSFLHRI